MTARPESDHALQIGKILTDARRRQGIDIETVEQETKIRAKYLLALENEEWDVLPGPAYARGFIRSYADLLGIDGEVLVDEYRRRHHEEPATGSYDLRESVLRERRVRDDGRQRPASRLLILAAIIASVAIVLLIVGITSGGEEGDGSRGKQGERGERREGAGRQEGGGSDKQSPRKVPDKVTVKLVARSDLEACLVNNHGQVLVPDQLLTAGTEDGPYVSKRFRVELDPAAAQIMVNGKPARAAPPSRKPAAYTVTPRRVRDANYTGDLCR
jgi:cytoskeleton protein RodZ